jgi:ElaB/YqjD/DUF883 family membrane-anchored ribosome-binding protein
MIGGGNTHARKAERGLPCAFTTHLQRGETMTPTPTTNQDTEGEGAATAAAPPIVERLAEGAHRVVDQIAGSAGPAVERVRSTVAETVDSVGRQIDGLGEKREAWLESSRETVRDNPMVALGAAFAAGIVFALLMRSRD